MFRMATRDAILRLPKLGEGDGRVRLYSEGEGFR